jgi:HSP20 family protein
MALLMRPEPFSNEVNRLFNTLFDASEGTDRRWVPPTDLLEKDDHFVLKVDLPGLAEGDVAIEVQDNTLTLSGERKAEHEDHSHGWYRIERSCGRFSRSLTLPEGVDPDGIAAEFDRGVLEVRIPKPEQRKPRRVEIKAGPANGKPAAVEGTASEN